MRSPDRKNPVTGGGRSQLPRLLRAGRAPGVTSRYQRGGRTVQSGWKWSLYLRLIAGWRDHPLTCRTLFSPPTINQSRRTTMMQMTDVARDKIKELMQEHPGKHLRIILEGFG
jgi:hypothetical protein